MDSPRAGIHAPWAWERCFSVACLAGMRFSIGSRSFVPSNRGGAAPSFGTPRKPRWEPHTTSFSRKKITPNTATMASPTQNSHIPISTIT